MHLEVLEKVSFYANLNLLALWLLWSIETLPGFQYRFEWMVVSDVDTVSLACYATFQRQK